MVERRDAADLTVLSCESRHGPAVQSVWRSAGQQLVGRRVAVPGRYRKEPVGEHVRRRWLLDVRRSTDPAYIYAESQGGYIGRVNRKTHETRDIQPLPFYKESKLRFNWNTPIHVSPTK